MNWTGKLRFVAPGCAVLGALLTTSCSTGISERDACEELVLYSDELAYSIDGVGQNLDELSLRRPYAESMQRLAEDLEQMDIADSELDTAVAEWSESIKVVAAHLRRSDRLFNDASYRTTIAGDVARMETQALRLLRLCG